MKANSEAPGTVDVDVTITLTTTCRLCEYTQTRCTREGCIMCPPPLVNGLCRWCAWATALARKLVQAGDPQ